MELRQDLIYEENSSFRLNLEEQAVFERDGYVIQKAAFSPKEVSECLDCLERLVDKAKGYFEQLKEQGIFPTKDGTYYLSDRTPFEVKTVRGNFGYHFDYLNPEDPEKSTYVVIDQTAAGNLAIRRFVWAYGTQPKLAEISEKFFESASQLLGCRVADWLINSVHPRLVGDEDTEAKPHQDRQNREFFDPDWEVKAKNRKGSYIVAITALDRATKENGGLFVVPGMRRGRNNEIIMEATELSEEEVERIRKNMSPSTSS